MAFFSDGSNSDCLSGSAEIHSDGLSLAIPCPFTAPETVELDLEHQSNGTESEGFQTIFALVDECYSALDGLILECRYCLALYDEAPFEQLTEIGATIYNVEVSPSHLVGYVTFVLHAIRTLAYPSLGQGNSPYNTDRCGICLEPYASHSMVKQLHCAHYFHASCIEMWLLQGVTAREGILRLDEVFEEERLTAIAVSSLVADAVRETPWLYSGNRAQAALLSHATCPTCRHNTFTEYCQSSWANEFVREL